MFPRRIATLILYENADWFWIFKTIHLELQNESYWSINLMRNGYVNFYSQTHNENMSTSSHRCCFFPQPLFK